MGAVPLPTDGLSIHQRDQEGGRRTGHRIWTSASLRREPKPLKLKDSEIQKIQTESCNVCLNPLFEFQFMMLRSAIANSLDWMWPGNLGNWGKGPMAHPRTTYPARWHTYWGSQPSTPPAPGPHSARGLQQNACCGQGTCHVTGINIWNFLSWPTCHESRVKVSMFCP